MDSQDPTSEFVALFHRVYERFHRRDRTDGVRVSPESLAVLSHLDRSGPLTIREASGHFERSQAATSELVTRLERRGLVERLADERDRRRTLVWLTPTGSKVLADHTTVLSTKLLTHAFQQMEPATSDAVVRALRTLLETDPAPPGVKDD